MCGLLIAPLNISLSVGVDGQSEILCFVWSQYGLPLRPFALAKRTKTFALWIAPYTKQHLSGVDKKASSFANVEPCRHSPVD
jgi:hypothetical protein